MKCHVKMLAVWVAIVGWARPASAAEAKLRPADYVAVIGDSITEQRLYSAVYRGLPIVNKNRVARDASAAAVKPVRHSLKLEAVQ